MSNVRPLVRENFLSPLRAQVNDQVIAYKQRPDQMPEFAEMRMSSRGIILLDSQITIEISQGEKNQARVVICTPDGAILYDGQNSCAETMESNLHMALASPKNVVLRQRMAQPSITILMFALEGLKLKL